jgi:hypothetical protein
MKSERKISNIGETSVIMNDTDENWVGTRVIRTTDSDEEKGHRRYICSIQYNTVERNSDVFAEYNIILILRDMYPPRRDISSRM